MSTASGADVDLDHDRAWRTMNGHADRVLHAAPDCPGLNQADVESITEVDPELYRPHWNWCRRCSDAEDRTDQSDAGKQDSGRKPSAILEQVDSLDEARRVTADEGVETCGRVHCHREAEVEYPAESGMILVRCRRHALEDAVDGIGPARAAEIHDQMTVPEFIRTAMESDGVPDVIEGLAYPGKGDAEWLIQQVRESPLVEAIDWERDTPDTDAARGKREGRA